MVLAAGDRRLTLDLVEPAGIDAEPLRGALIGWLGLVDDLAFDRACDLACDLAFDIAGLMGLAANGMASIEVVTLSGLAHAATDRHRRESTGSRYGRTRGGGMVRRLASSADGARARTGRPRFRSARPS